MTFGDFVEVYMKDLNPRLKENTIHTKENIIYNQIVPYFENKKINNIKPNHIVEWQNEMLAFRSKSGEPYSPCYLKTLHNQLSAIFNHAVRYYELKTNPAKLAGSMGKEKGKEIKFWTKEEYLKFSEALNDRDLVFHAFEILYWCGLRIGELLALTPSDFDFEKSTIKIDKSYQRLKCKDIITTPKTEKSNRTVKMPSFLKKK